MTIHEEIRAYVLEALLPGEDASNLQDDDDLLDTGILDSVALVSMILHLEQTYGIELAREEVVPEHFASVSAIAEFVESKQRQNAKVGS